MKIISVSNVKGGVGKTSTAAILSAGLTQRGNSVLMIDSDPQTNLTMCFLPEPPDGTPSIYHVYADGKSLDEVKTSIKENLDLIIGDFELCNADMQFLKAGRLKMLRKAIKSIKSDYDFIVIDTPPNLGILSLNAFLVSDYIIVPIDRKSTRLNSSHIR